mgnify:FL=1
MKYTKQNIQKKRQILSSEKIRRNSKISLFLFKYAFIISIALIVTGLGLGVGFVRGILKTTPQITKDSVHSKGYITTIYDNKGSTIKTLSNHDSNRIYTPLSSVPKNLQHAFIAIEDERYYSHNGIDLYGIIRATFLGIRNQSLSQGGSTITQQLIKNNVLGIQPEKTTMERLERKIKEQSLALELEKIASKQYILEEYLNAINLGEGTLGVQTASQKYFNKDVSELTLSECAVLASITKNPTRLNPVTHPENNASRRLLVLQNMLEQHYITKKEYREALSDDVYTRIQKNAAAAPVKKTTNSYFEDALILQVVKDLKKQLGYDETKAYNAIYSGGLKIYSTQDQQIQKIADSVTNDASNYPKATKIALSYSLSAKTVSGKDVVYSDHNLLDYMRKNNLGNQLIFTDEASAKTVVTKFKQYILSKGETITNESFQTTIQPQISMTIMNQSNGTVEALVGGRGNKTSDLSLNRATGTTRQPGSTFKILSAFLPALDKNHMTLATVYEDAPYNYIDTNRPVRNYYKGYKGYSTIREAITNSMNVVSAKTIADVTPKTSFEYLMNLGFSTLVSNETTSNGNVYTDITQSLSLGGLTYGVTNMELTSAYASIANGGTYQKPVLYTKVVDHNGNILLSNTQKGKRVMKESTAFLLTDAMKDVITKGTGKSAKLSSSMAVAGKSGTTSNSYDYWFSGYTPYHTASVWMGYDKNTNFASDYTHKKIWAKVMNEIIKTKQEQTTDFKKPADIVKAKVCKESGKLAIKGVCDHDPRGSRVITEYFEKGTVPTQTCDIHVAVEVCKTSDKLATKNCPANKKQRKIYIVRKKGSHGKTADTPYLLPKKYQSVFCKKH